jgi:quinol-cytochrome oxidoreductase complex cytochrome b subunit
MKTMREITRHPFFPAATIAFIIFLAGGGVVIASLATATTHGDIDHAMWVTWLIVVPAFLVFCAAGLIAAHQTRHHRP